MNSPFSSVRSLELDRCGYKLPIPKVLYLTNHGISQPIILGTYSDRRPIHWLVLAWQEYRFFGRTRSEYSCSGLEQVNGYQILRRVFLSLSPFIKSISERLSSSLFDFCSFSQERRVASRVK